MAQSESGSVRSYVRLFYPIGDHESEQIRKASMITMFWTSRCLVSILLATFNKRQIQAHIEEINGQMPIL